MRCRSRVTWNGRRVTRVLGEDHPSTLASRGLAGAYRSAGRLAEAIPLYEQTLTDRLRVPGENHPDTLNYRNDLTAASMRAAPVRRRGKSRKEIGD